MPDGILRRTLLSGALAAGGLARPGAAQGMRTPGSLTRASVEAEIVRRAEHQARQRYLVVDYYRIRRQLAYPLPVTSLSLPDVPAPTISGYPWATWMLWALEERVHALGWAAEFTGRRDFAEWAARDLEALAEWPKYCQYPQPDLSSGHAGRLLQAALRWRWVSAAAKQKLRDACRRHVDEVLPLAETYYGPVRSKTDLLSLPEPFRKLPNIPLIGTLAAAMTAYASRHPGLPILREKVRAVLGAILELRSQGLTEGVAYDGYILDFVADWLGTLPAPERTAELAHPNWRHYLEESYRLAVPGAIEDVAELSDVEPREMPFHYSAQAKLAAWRPDATRAWYLGQWRPGRIRADALGLLRDRVEGLAGPPPESGSLTAYYAHVLRTGWEPEDLAVAISCTNSPMSHVQQDNGTVVVGTHGRWLIADPGYQQYMRDAEREFTIGPAAHNYPLPGGAAQDRKDGRLIRARELQPGWWHAEIDLTKCYPASAGLRQVVRSVWLDGRKGVVIADRIDGGSGNVRYHWHGHPEAAWWVRDGWVLLHVPQVDLWFTSPQVRLSGSLVRRLPGSRGQLTLVAEAEAAPAIWWVFAVGSARPEVEAEGGGIRVGGRHYRV